MYLQNEKPKNIQQNNAIGEILQANIEDYLIPYVIVCCGVIAIIAFTFGKRKNQHQLIVN